MIVWVVCELSPWRVNDGFSILGVFTDKTEAELLVQNRNPWDGIRVIREANLNEKEKPMEWYPCDTRGEFK